MRILVTGAGGMLGQDLLAAAGRRRVDAVGVARAECDITDPAAVRAAVGETCPDVVINAAAWTDVDGAEEREPEAAAVNGAGAGHVAAAAADAGATVVHVSTDYVFDGRGRRPYVEGDATSPLNAYGRTKLAGEQAVAAANPRHHVVRSSWLFGVGGPNFVATMLRVGAERDELTVVDDQVGCPTWTGHLAEALLDLAAREDGYGIHHGAASGSCSWHAFAVEIFARTGMDVTVHPGRTADLGRPAPRPAYSVLGSGRADALVLPDWRAGLDGYLAARAAEVTP
jgi:dTDP-4-dehydrorhamnose reductase